METWNDRIKRLRLAAGHSQVDAARLIGIRPPSYNAWESGETKELKGKNLARACQVFKVTQDYLLYGKEPGPATAPQEMSELAREVGTATNVRILREVPLISFAQAGNWAEVVDPYLPGVSDEWAVTTRKVGSRAYALRIKGDSMEPRIPDGAVVIIDPDREPENGYVVVVRQNHDSEATIKRLVIDGNQRYLKPDNPRYPIMSMAEDAVFCGVAVQVLDDLIP